jgi:hypothetical protein
MEENGPLLFCSADSNQTATRIASGECVKANGVGALPSDDQKWLNKGQFWMWSYCSSNRESLLSGNSFTYSYDRGTILGVKHTARPKW